MRTTFLTSAALAMVLAMPAFAFAQSTAAPSGTGTATPGAVQTTPSGTMHATTGGTWKHTLTSNEKGFLTRTAHRANYELAISRLALQKANRQDIKSYAQTVISDHQRLNRQLQQVSTANNFTLPTGMTKSEHQKYQSLDGKSGKSFDQAYINDIKGVNSHDVAQEKAELDKIADNPQLRSVVEQMHRTDQQHRQMARNLKA